MAFSEIIKFIPKLDDGALKNMERTFNSRFGRIAKNFGRGLKNVFKGGGILGAGIALINKILNPLKDVQESINRTLEDSSQVVANAEQFGTTPGTLLRLQKLAQSKGVDADQLYMLIGKFQSAVASANQDPKAPSVVSKYKDVTDYAAGFFEFIQALKNTGLNKNQQIYAQEQVFGEKQVLKVADFFNEDFKKRFKEIGAKPASYYDGSLKHLDRLSDLADALKANRELNDVRVKGYKITDGMIYAQHASEKELLKRENERLDQYRNLQAIADTSLKIMGLVEKGIGMIGSLINTVTPKITSIVNYLDKISKSSIFRPWFGKGKGD